jgi:OPA family glycerol-3-phosphate transporter-like MFS transporter
MIYWIPLFGQTPPEKLLAVVAALMGCFLAIAYVPWAAQFSETLEDVSPALQATGWAFYGLVARAWVAITAPLSLYIAGHYGWGAWIKVSAVGMAIYIVAMALTRRHAAVEQLASAAKPAQPVAAGR